MDLIDSHAHLDSEDLAGDLEGVMARARLQGVGRVVAIGLWRKDGDFGNALELAARWPGFFSATVGIHPHECARVGEADWARSAELAEDPRVVGVGETGLDFHYDLSPREVQEASFRRSLRIARAVGKPEIGSTGSNSSALVDRRAIDHDAPSSGNASDPRAAAANSGTPAGNGCEASTSTRTTCTICPESPISISQFTGPPIGPSSAMIAARCCGTSG